MTVDREQIRRDEARRLASDLSASLHGAAETVARLVDIFRIELEQAERECELRLVESRAANESIMEWRDEATRERQRAEQAKRERDEARLERDNWRTARDRHVTRLEQAEAQLAKLPALVAEVEETMWNGYAWIGLEPCVSCGGERPRHRENCELARALAAYEQEQKP